MRWHAGLNAITPEPESFAGPWTTRAAPFDGNHRAHAHHFTGVQKAVLEKLFR